MRWFRSNNPGVVWLAVFALTCHFVLTFGHFHSGKRFILTALTTSDTSPPREAPSSPGQDFCAVCNHISLGNALALSASPPAIVPISYVQVFWSPIIAAGATSEDCAHYCARGPPTSDHRASGMS
jgi:hypothetical protein